MHNSKVYLQVAFRRQVRMPQSLSERDGILPYAECGAVHCRWCPELPSHSCLPIEQGIARKGSSAPLPCPHSCWVCNAKVYRINVTKRDGVQTSRILLPRLSKTLLNTYPDEMGIYRSEVGFRTLKHEINHIQCANLHTQKTLTDDELRFIALHPQIVRKIVKVYPEEEHP